MAILYPRQFRCRALFYTLLPAVLISPLLLSPNCRATDAFIEPILSVGMGNTTFNPNGATVPSYGGGIRLALENEELFSGLELNAAMSDLGPGTLGRVVTFGITAGGTLVYLPIRMWVGLDFSDSYTDDVTLSQGYGLRVGINYFLSLHTALGLQYSNHSYGADSNGSTSNAGYNGISLVLSMPIPLSQPKEPWKSRYEKESAWKNETHEEAPHNQSDSSPSKNDANNNPAVAAPPPVEALPEETPPAPSSTDAPTPPSDAPPALESAPDTPAAPDALSDAPPPPPGDATPAPGSSANTPPAPDALSDAPPPPPGDAPPAPAAPGEVTPGPTTPNNAPLAPTTDAAPAAPNNELTAPLAPPPPAPAAPSAPSNPDTPPPPPGAEGDELDAPPPMP